MFQELMFLLSFCYTILSKAFKFALENRNLEDQKNIRKGESDLEWFFLPSSLPIVKYW